MTADVHMMTGAYVVDALPADEQRFFARHLAVCRACDVEVDEFLSTAAVLGSASAQAPPPAMREQVLHAIDVTRQAPPVPPSVRPSQRSGRGIVESLLASVAAVLAVALLVLSGVAVHLNERLVELETAQASTMIDDRALAVLAAPDAKTRTLDGAAGTSARLMYSPGLDTGVFVADGMDALPAESTYELWLFHDGTPIPATTFDTDQEGRGLAVVEGPLVGAEFAAVTVEPHGGSPAPTGTVIVQGPV